MIELVSLIVPDYDEAIDFFTGVLDFELVEDSPSTTNDGRAKRWVVVRPSGAQTGILLAKADGPQQEASVGEQFAGRVGLFLRTNDFQKTYQKLKEAGLRIKGQPRKEIYGWVVVFEDIFGNKWDLLG